VAQVDYLHLCDLAFMDQAGKHCIIGIFDVIRSNAFPATHPTMCVAMKLQGQSSEALKITFQLARPNGDVLVTIPMDIVAGQDGGANINLSLNQIQFPEPGRYTLKFLSGKDVLATQSLRLELAPPQQGPQPPPQEKNRLH
jgi:hypothetical protein